MIDLIVVSIIGAFILFGIVPFFIMAVCAIVFNTKLFLLKQALEKYPGARNAINMRLIFKDLDEYQDSMTALAKILTFVTFTDSRFKNWFAKDMGFGKALQIKNKDIHERVLSTGRWLRFSTIIWMSWVVLFAAAFLFFSIFPHALQ